MSHVTARSEVRALLAAIRKPVPRLELLVTDDELARRRASWQPPAQLIQRGWTRLYQQHVTQAHEGCDLDFLSGTAATPEPVIF
jgi:dihydroxy-acid dehydratase